MLNLNQIERQKKERSPKSCVKQKGQKVCSREDGRAKKPKRQHRMGKTRLEKNTNDQKQTCHDQNNHNRAIAKADSRRLDQSVNECTQTERRQDCADPIDSHFFPLRVFGDMSKRNQDNESCDWKIN